MSRTPRRLVALALLAACAWLGSGCGDAPVSSTAPEGRAYDLEGRPLRTLTPIQGWSVAVLAFEDPPEGEPAAPTAEAASTQAVCSSPVVWPSAASLLTGLLPAAHGVQADGAVPAGYARAWTTAAEVLRSAYAVETVALRTQGWPAETLPLLQGFTTRFGPGEPPALLEAWRAQRSGDGPFFVYLQLTGPSTQTAALLAALRHANGGCPLLWAVTHLRGAALAAEADFLEAYAERTLLVPLYLGLSEAPAAPPAPSQGVSQRHLLAHLLERLGAAALPGLQGERWAMGADAAAIFEWSGSSPGTGGARTRLLRGARDQRYTYAVAWDSKEGTLLEHLIDRQAAEGPTDRVGPDGRLPELPLGSALCAAIELVRDLTWAGVDDVNWRIRSGYLADRRVVPGERPPPACGTSPAARTGATGGR